MNKENIKITLKKDRVLGLNFNEILLLEKHLNEGMFHDLSVKDREYGKCDDLLSKLRRFIHEEINPA